MGRVLRWRLRRRPSSIRQARAVITEHIDDPDRAWRAGALVSELVSHAVAHGLDPIELRLRRVEGRLRIEVSDSMTDQPVGMLDADRGAGVDARWLLIEAFSDAWGLSIDATGRTIWVEIAD